MAIWRRQPEILYCRNSFASRNSVDLLPRLRIAAMIRERVVFGK